MSADPKLLLQQFQAAGVSLMLKIPSICVEKKDLLPKVVNTKGSNITKRKLRKLSSKMVFD
jgi:hypothetical protein